MSGVGDITVSNWLSTLVHDHHALSRITPLQVDLAGICALLRSSVEAAAHNGLPMRKQDLVLKPQEKLVDLVRKSREQALRGAEEPDEAG
jgi:hypothetical protein